ncbi:hypothetical protein PAXRUDRAFT_28566 [Paxillus rubicundulus Ve08.2h10]|uniref:Uncharacterized protein n=1 Tax=Paxillus rubicundulus Ve08.2h10 TaxID=930991 RepID=A0A0D0C6E7_9AGAM|nr:hypothetical protein PAXRUDRAFT_28566 [Paxillus rubicundulus Ve08.2h10]
MVMIWKMMVKKLSAPDFVLQQVEMVVGTSIPHSMHTRALALFALCHFKPFSHDLLLLAENKTLEEAYQNFCFSEDSWRVMNKWEAIHKYCVSKLNAQQNHLQISLNPVPQHLEMDLLIHQTLLALKQACWLEPPCTLSELHILSKLFMPSSNKDPNDSGMEQLVFSDQLLKFWKPEIKILEITINEACQNALNPEQQISPTGREDSESVGITKSTIAKGSSNLEEQTASDVIEKIRWLNSLNEKQWWAFQIIAKHFVQTHVKKIPCNGNSGPNQLFMLMTGLGAPTGSAASLIDGMTIHKGLGIKIKSNNKGKGNHKPGESSKNHTVLITVQNHTRL